MGDEAALGLIAGIGALPIEALAHLRKAGHAVRVFGFDGLCEEAFVPVESRTRLGQLSAFASLLRKHAITKVLIVGGFDPGVVQSPGAAFDPDAEALAMLAKSGARDPSALMERVAEWLADQGFILLRQDELLRGMLAGQGALAGEALTPREEAEVATALGTLRSAAPSFFGQAFVLRDGKVVAVEDEAGTDAMIRGLGERAGSQTLIVKASRVGQDPRLDLPAIGPGTIQAMAEVGVTTLAVESGQTLLIDSPELTFLAESLGIRVWGFDASRGQR